MAFITAKRTLGFKLEGTAYTAETLAATDYDVPATDISFTPDVAKYERKLSRGNLSMDLAIPGKRSATISFKVALCKSDAVATPPTYFKCLVACGMKQTIHSTTGVSLVLSDDCFYTAVPATIEVVEKNEGASPVQMVFKAKGCMGTAKFELNSLGEPVAITFEFKGCLVSIADRPFTGLLTPTGFNAATPDPVLSATITAFGEAQKCDKVTIDLANDVQMFSDPSDASGYQGAHIVNRKPKIDLDPDLDLIANRGDYARLTTATSGAFAMTIGASLAISAPAIQLMDAYKVGDREGHITNPHSFAIIGGSGDDFKLLQGAEA